MLKGESKSNSSAGHRAVDPRAINYMEVGFGILGGLGIGHFRIDIVYMSLAA
jgi:hypothetical protein